MFLSFPSASISTFTPLSTRLLTEGVSQYPCSPGARSKRMRPSENLGAAAGAAVGADAALSCGLQPAAMTVIKTTTTISVTPHAMPLAIRPRLLTHHADVI